MSIPLLTFRGNSGVPVDLDRLIESRLLIQANSGGGKSRAIRYLCEQTHGRIQQIIIDREGEFATLREKFPYLLFGREGDFAADLQSAKLLARKLLELGTSAIIDLSEMGQPQQRHYVALFLESLMHQPRDLWKDCLIIIDEAHLFAPQRQKKGTTSDSLAAIELLLSAGRKRGYCAVLATQRLAKLDKDVANECLNKLIGRTSFDDSKRAGEELGQRKDASRDLVSLDPGSFWAYGPAIAVDPVLVRTGDVQTAPPKRGTSRAPAPPTPDAIKKVLSELADLPKRAADEERSMQDLQKDLASLRRQLTIAQKSGTERIVEKTVVDKPAIDRAVNAAVATERKRVVRELRTAHSGLSKHLVSLLALPDAIGKIAGLANELAASNGTGATVKSIDGDPLTRIVAPIPVPRAKKPDIAPVASSNEEGEVTGPQQRILNTLAGFRALGIDEPGKSNVAVFSGVSPRSSGYQNNLSRLRVLGFIEYPGADKCALTHEGEALARNEVSFSTLGELHRAWYAKLSKPQAKLLEVLIDAYPHHVGRAELAGAAGVSVNSSGFQNNLSSLRTLGLIDYSRDKNVFATDLLFPEGLS